MALRATGVKLDRNFATMFERSSRAGLYGDAYIRLYGHDTHRSTC